MVKINFKEIWKLITSNTECTIGFVIVSLFVLTVIIESIGGWAILPYNPLQTMTAAPLSPPSFAHPFGTEELGRDLLSRIIAGAPIDAYVSFCVVGFSFLFGGFLGSLAGYSRGPLDEILMRVTDVFFSIPALILAMAVVFVLGNGPVNVMIALAIIWWPAYARLARAEALRLRGMNFVISARLGGVSTLRIVTRHIFRVSMTTLLIYATLDVGTVILIYSGLSYLGLAVRIPYPDWGVMVGQSEQYAYQAPWLPLIPALVIFVVAFGFSLLGDGLKKAMQMQRGM
jgi:peptide/nickel transport system permease protein